MGDLEKCMPESEGGKQGCMACSCLCGVGSLIGFIILMSSYHHLGPNEQILIKKPGGNEIIDGPGTFMVNPSAKMERRDAIVLNPYQYAVIQDELTGVKRHIEGPQLFWLQPYDQLNSVEPKLVLYKDDYIKLVDRTGRQRVAVGPRMEVPEPWETSPNGTQKAVMVDTDTAVLVLSVETGQQRLVTENGVFAPLANEEILETRPIIHVLPHEAIVIKDQRGQTTVFSGNETGEGMGFFVPPFNEIWTMRWSDYSEDPTIGMQRRLQSGQSAIPPTENVRMMPVTKIDLRSQKIFFRYEVRTRDHVNLHVTGTIFWQVMDIRRLLLETPDPVGNIHTQARSTMNQAVSNYTLREFMVSMRYVADRTFEIESTSDYYSSRGIAVQSIELTSFTAAEATTAATLRQIITETTERINRMTAQRSENEVRQRRIEAEIRMEEKRRQLLEIQSENSRLSATAEGESAGTGIARTAKAFIDGLRESNTTNVSTAVELYQMREHMRSANQDTQNIATGNAKLFLTPEDMNLRLGMNTAEL